MPTKAVKQFDAWSYSRLTDYESCPFFARCKHLDKLPTPAGPAMARGRWVHDAAEKYATGTIAKLPEPLKLFKAEFAALRKIKRLLQTELQQGLNSAWEPCAWFGPETWARLVLDLMYDPPQKPFSRLVVDYKTGRTNPGHKEQLSLYAIGAFATAPKNIKRVDTELWYLDQGEQSGATFVRDDLPALKKQWAKRVAPMLADKTFKPTPGSCCAAYGKPCPFKKSEGGPCKH